MLNAIPDGRVGGPSTVLKAPPSGAQSDPKAFVSWLSLRIDLIFKFRMEPHFCSGPQNREKERWMLLFGFYFYF